MVAILPRISGDIARRSANAVTAVGNHHAINGRIFDGLPDKVLSISVGAARFCTNNGGWIGQVSKAVFDSFNFL